MKKLNLLRVLAAFAAAAALAFGVPIASQAATTNGTMTVSGTATDSCSFSSSTISLGSVNLNGYLVSAGTNTEYVSVPISIGVTCTASSVAWTMYNTNDSTATPTDVLTIGSDSSNHACISTTSASSTISCVTAGMAQIYSVTGTGSGTASATLQIQSASPTVKGYRGTGTISGSIPLTLSF